MLRFAPSPTGDIHIGNLRAAIINFIIAKQQNEQFLIRIEDTDKERNIENKDKEILSILNLFGLFWDKLVYQSQNFAQHRILAQELLKKNKAFYCYCTKEFLEEKKNEAIKNNVAFRYDDSWADLCKSVNPTPSIRLKGSEGDISFIDEIKGECAFNKNEIDSFVIMRNDGIPTYNFACACDDMIYDISYIIRGEDHTSNTPKQILIRKYLGYDKAIKHAHLPIILNKNGKKMSKRENESSVQWLINEGYLPSAIINYLISIGNKPKSEIFYLKDAIEWFDIKDLSKSPPKFDIDKLRYINREHLNRLNLRDLGFLVSDSSSVLDFKENDFATLGAIAKIYLEESSTLNEIREKIESIFAKKEYSGEFENEIKRLKKIILELIKSEDSSLEEFDEFKNELMKRSGLKGKALFFPLRFLLTNQTKGPQLHDLYPYLRFYLSQILKEEA